MKSPTARRASLDQHKIAEAAATLTRKVGLSGWSIRDLASALGVVPSVIYHHFTNRDAIVHAVSDLVTAQVVIPDDDLPWKDWCLQLALNVRTAVLPYPGLSECYIRGDFTAAQLRILDAFYQKLHSTGFGEHTAIAQAMLANGIMWTITARNLRSLAYQDRRHDLPTMIEQLTPMVDTYPSLAAMLEAFVIPLANPETEETLSLHYFDLMIRVMLEGLESLILRGEGIRSDDDRSEKVRGDDAKTDAVLDSPPRGEN